MIIVKICWDNLKSVSLNSNGNFVKNKTIYIESGPCLECGNMYLLEKRNRPNHGYCSRACCVKNRVLSEATKRKISKANTGNKHSNEAKRKIGLASKGKKLSIETRRKMSESQLGDKNHMFGKKPYNYRGVKDKGNTLYDTYSEQLLPYEDVRRSKVLTELLEVKCTYCGSWFSPSCINVKNRLASINNGSSGENRFYCSDGCKNACPTYGQRKYPRGFKKATSREVNPLLRQMCFERDNWTCQLCGKTVQEVSLHCHHIEGYTKNPLLGNDVENVITLCKECHKDVHKLPGCNYHELRCDQ